MGVLATQMVNFRTKLAAAPASLTNATANVSIDNPPDNGKTWFSVTCLAESSLGATFGGGSLVEYERAIIVKVAHFKNLDEEAISDTVANDLENIDAVMLKDSNKSGGVVLVTKETESSEDRGAWIRSDLRYRVRFRVAQDLT